MAKFIYKLDGVLRQRKHIENERQRDLAVCRQRFQVLKDELDRLNADVTNSTQDLRNNHLTGKLDMQFLAAHRQFKFAMERQAVTILQKMTLAQRSVDEAQVLLMEAARQRKAVEKLREKAKELWRADLARREQAETDEIGAQIAHHHLTETD